jgi:hypothetical protein
MAVRLSKRGREIGVSPRISITLSLDFHQNNSQTITIMIDRDQIFDQASQN